MPGATPGYEGENFKMFCNHFFLIPRTCQILIFPVYKGEPGTICLLSTRVCLESGLIIPFHLALLFLQLVY